MSEETTEIMEETAEVKEAATETKTEKPKKKSLLSDNAVEVLVAIFLGITALLTAWASWIGSLHGGNQATNYTTSNNLASEGNSEYNAGMQLYLSDLMAWNTMMEYAFDKTLAEAEGNEVEAALIQEKLNNYIQQNSSAILINAFNNMTEDMQSPFEVPGMLDEYFVDANELLSQSRDYLEQGKIDNAHGDAYSLVNVIYSVVLFMLGIVGIFKKIPNRTAVLIIAVVGLIGATIYMCTIPLPTGFDFFSYFSGN